MGRGSKMPARRLKGEVKAPEYVIQLLELVSGESNPAEGMYVKEYDPAAFDGRGSLVTTPDKDLARRFPDSVAAAEFWRQPCGLRADGRPNRPLTAWTVEITRL